MPVVILNINCRKVFVDDEDLPILSRYSWYIDGNNYAFTLVGGKALNMHRLLCPLGEVVDHIDQNPLNNSKSNLRPATRSQNAINRGKTARNSAGYKGVFFHKKTKKFKAAIRVNYTLYHLGTFSTAVEAAIAYNKAAVEYFGPFAFVNPLET